MSLVEREYQARINQLSPKQRISRMVAMASWSREIIARQLRNEHRTASEERLKWLLLLRLYGNEPQVGPLIRERLANVRD